ncbi:hypothetical protein DCAR_0727656 [Daucus carota subsp. sativus]|uniref:Uncharacterized protein n=1 Tax=Daucus carota subsp. sativus TaxID=79200 RepID=A0AAF0XJP0_DAUCS|nr:PREDICTED: uncharacterized protein LOC108193366 [Daucus carota subsp. sativus]WOH08219.1 hypothetical protein DCAR_0727656 [Daucus carota subsp. sativus]
MAAAGNLSLLDIISPRTIITDRKNRAELLLNLFKKESLSQQSPILNLNALIASNGFEFDKHSEIKRLNRSGKVNSKVNNAVDYESSSDDESNGIDDDEVDSYDWEKEMKKRVKEIQEMKELEKKAEELVSEIGEEDGEGSGESEEEKKMRVRKELEKVAKEQAERRKTAELMFDLGQRAYGKGMYGRAIEFLEGALTIIPRPTLFGGEIQIWLAMAYEANNRHKDCIALYRQLELKHPSFSIRRQAAELRYILQAPKLKISQEEMVTIPLIGSSYDNYAGTWNDKYKDSDGRLNRSTTNQLPSSKDFVGDFLVWRPPVDLEKNQAFWVVLTLWLGLVGAALFIQK